MGVIKTLYVKWVLKHCRHFCFCCTYKSEHCKDYFASLEWKEIKRLYKK